MNALRFCEANRHYFWLRSNVDNLNFPRRDKRELHYLLSIVEDWQGVNDENDNKQLTFDYHVGMYGCESPKLLINWSIYRGIISTSICNPYLIMHQPQQQVPIQLNLTTTFSDFITPRRILLKGIFDLILLADFSRGPGTEVIKASPIIINNFCANSFFPTPPNSEQGEIEIALSLTESDWLLTPPATFDSPDVSMHSDDGLSEYDNYSIDEKCSDTRIFLNKINFSA
jgi:hypothetical protein